MSTGYQIKDQGIALATMGIGTAVAEATPLGGSL